MAIVFGEHFYFEHTVVQTGMRKVLKDFSYATAQCTCLDCQYF